MGAEGLPGGKGVAVGGMMLMIKEQGTNGRIGRHYWGTWKHPGTRAAGATRDAGGDGVTGDNGERE